MSDEDLDLDDELDDDELDDEDLDDDELDDDELDEDMPEDLDDELDGDGSSEEDDDDEDQDEVPRARARPGTDDDEDDDVNPDDIEADLDSILKDKIASSDDEDDEDDDGSAAPTKDSSEKVNAKAADEFTCDTCFLIVHPRQFGRAGSLSCPEGYDPCPSIKKVERMLGKAKKA
ncbi:MAG: DUF4193 family protein [Microthrixaceae bacterium]